MSIYSDLNNVGNLHVLDIYKKPLLEHHALCTALADCKTADEVLPFIKAELLGRNRFSYLLRIYGRYRKLLPERDMELMKAWREDYEGK